MGCKLRVDFDRKIIAIIIDYKSLLVDIHDYTMLLSTVTKIGNNI